MIWIVYFLVIALYFILKDFKTNTAKKYYLIIITLVLCTLTALRHFGMGNDTYAYYMHFIGVENSSYTEYFQTLNNSIFEQSSDETKDPGYNIFAKFLYELLDGNYELYQFFVAALVLVPIALFIKKYVIHFSGYIISYIFFISIFYSWMPNSATRQSIAIGLYFWAIWFFLRNKKYLLPLLLIAIAATIHKSVLINIIPCVLLIKKDKSWYPKYALIGLVAIFILGSSIAIWLGGISMSSNYQHYGLSSYYERASKPYGFIIQMTAIFTIALYGKINMASMNKAQQFIAINFLMSIIFVPIILVDPSLQRLTAYFALWGVIFIPNIINEFSTSQRPIIYLIILCLTFGRPLITGDQDYKFNWEQKELHKRYKN